MAIFKILDVSTAYVPKDEMARIADAPTFLASYPEGAFLWVTEGTEEAWEWEGFPNLRNLNEKAREADCMVLRLDADGDFHIEGLPRFEWED